MREEQAQDHGFKHALEGAAGPGVPIVLQFVGLSVPADMHKQQEQLGNTVTAAYYLVRACMLCIAACKSSLCCACFSLNGLALSLLNKVVMRGWGDYQQLADEVLGCSKPRRLCQGTHG
eukprot:scaffold64068_cov24-Tisochrysis_lutea.AAC.3